MQKTPLLLFRMCVCVFASATSSTNTGGGPPCHDDVKQGAPFVLSALMTTALCGAPASFFQVVYKFPTAPDYTDGSSPVSAVTRGGDARGVCKQRLSTQFAV